jgi:hypothetical protein
MLLIMSRISIRLPKDYNWSSNFFIFFLFLFTLNTTNLNFTLGVPNDTFSLSIYIHISQVVLTSYITLDLSGVLRNFFGRGSTNLVEDRGHRERASGGGSPLLSGSTQFANA